MQLTATYQCEAYAGFHVSTFHTDSAPQTVHHCFYLRIPLPCLSATPWQLCERGNLGSMESNVMAGRALQGCLQLPTGQDRHAIFLVL